MVNTKYRIQNIVLTLSYKDVKFDLKEISSSLERARYDPEVFPGVAYRTSEPKASFLIFTSGEASCIGATSIIEAEDAIDKLTKKFRDIGLSVGEPEVEVQNVVASFKFERDFDLESITRNFRQAEYNQKVFPRPTFRLKGTNVTFLLFPSGEGICAGAKSEKELENAIDELDEMIG